MRPLDEYQVYIFDCDGVILDSNRLKVSAMRQSLQGLQRFAESEIDQCVQFFAENFGKSRFFHIRHFVGNILTLSQADADQYYEALLGQYSAACKQLYLEAGIAPGFIEYITALEGDKYVASGSAQDELRWVFQQRGLDVWFRAIYGSPTPKNEIVANIVNSHPGKKIVLIGDSVSDFNASAANNVNFVYYGKFSLVNEAMLNLAAEHRFPVLNDFQQPMSLYEQ
jgi:phosphoglycolate phosphatase-like HAD superfamily hydrolase